MLGEREKEAKVSYSFVHLSGNFAFVHSGPWPFDVRHLPQQQQQQAAATTTTTIFLCTSFRLEKVKDLGPNAPSLALKLAGKGEGGG